MRLMPVIWITSFIYIIASLLVILALSIYTGVNLYNFELIELEVCFFLVSSAFCFNLFKEMSAKESIIYMLSLLEGSFSLFLIFMYFFMAIYSLFVIKSVYGFLVSSLCCLIYMLLKLKSKE